MDFIRYAESAAALLNTELTDVDALLAHLGTREWLHPTVIERDVASLRGFQAVLRPVFEASDRGDVSAVVTTLNDLLIEHPVTPMISDHDPHDLHMHVANRAASVSELLISESLMGLANLVCDLGRHPPRAVPGRQVRPRLRRHLTQPVAPLLLRAVLVACQRRGVPRSPEGCRPVRSTE